MFFTGEQLKEIWAWAIHTSHPYNRSLGCICFRMIRFASRQHPHWRETPMVWPDQCDHEGYVAWNTKCPVHGVPEGDYEHPDGPAGPVWYEAWWNKMQEKKVAA